MEDHHLRDRDDIVGSARNVGAHGVHAGLNTLGDFRKFLLRGNVVDLAVGVIIGAAFNSVVQSMVTDLVQPLIGLLFPGGVKSFDAIKIGPQQQFLIGHFIGIVISFLITAAVVYFLVVKPITALEDRFSPKQQPATPTTRECPFCLSTVPLKATRCAYCTAQLPPAEDPRPQPATA
jgi:large conductance mechanosensitive channel